MGRTLGEKKKRKKVFITLSTDLLEEIDSLARESGASRSSVIALALAQYFRTTRKLILEKDKEYI